MCGKCPDPAIEGDLLGIAFPSVNDPITITNMFSQSNCFSDNSSSDLQILSLKATAWSAAQILDNAFLKPERLSSTVVVSIVQFAIYLRPEPRSRWRARSAFLAK